MGRLMQGLAVPYGEPTAIVEEDADGKRRIYAEQFDRDSFAEIPDRVPFIRAHNLRTAALGWAALESRERGLVATLTPIDGSVAASDAVAEVASGVTTSLSVSFYPSPEDDLVDTRDRAALPLIRRRNVELREVSLCVIGAYPSAKIYAADLDGYRHEQSERVLVPYRAEQERKRAEQRRADAELLDRIDRQASVRWTQEPLRSPESDRSGQGGRLTLPARADAFYVGTVDGGRVKVARRSSIIETELDAIAWVDEARQLAESLAITHRIPPHVTMARLGVELG